jgi:signal transduction histidine kinase
MAIRFESRDNIGVPGGWVEALLSAWSSGAIRVGNRVRLPSPALDRIRNCGPILTVLAAETGRCCMTGRYQRAVDLIELINLFQQGPTGFSIQQIADHFAVSRRTAERMLGALQRRFPELQHELRKGRKYWRFVPAGQTLCEWTGDGEPAEVVASRRGSEAELLRRSRWLTASANPRDALAGTIAESLRGPVSTIGLIARSALDSDAAGAQEALERIGVLAERMSHTIDRTLQLVRRSPPERQLISARKLLEDLAEDVRREAQAVGVQVEIKAASGLPNVYVDSALVVAALADLVRNAIDAMPDGGRLLLRAELGDGGKTVCFDVEDTGTGIPAGEEEWIFEPFYTTRDEGAGLGLAMARECAREHGGRIEVLPHSGLGACLRMQISVEGSPA